MHGDAGAGGEGGGLGGGGRGVGGGGGDWKGVSASRGPQSVQSVPMAHRCEELPGPPSVHLPSPTG